MQSGTTTVQGMKIFYVQAGEGEPLVYIHGNTGSSLWFSKVMEVPGYRCVALDLPNFGHSDPYPEEADIHGYADVVAQFIENLKLGSVTAVGHSLGGAVAQSLAIRYPGKVKALVLVDSASPRGLVTPRDRHPLIEMMRKDRSILAKALAATVPSLKDTALFEALVDEAVLMAAPAWIGNAEALCRFDLGDSPAGFKGPVLVLWGKSDFLVTETMASETVQAYPNARLEALDGVGHSVIVENPALFLRALAYIH
jgi:branched-chain amino acid transport system permease protein